MADNVNASNFLDAYYESLNNRQQRQNRQQAEVDKREALARQWQDANTRQQTEQIRAKAELATAQHQQISDQNTANTNQAKVGMDYINAIASGVARPEQKDWGLNNPTTSPQQQQFLADTGLQGLPGDASLGNPIVHLGNEVQTPGVTGGNMAPLPPPNTGQPQLIDHRTGQPILPDDGQRPTLMSPPKPDQGLGLVPINPGQQNQVKQDILEKNAPLEADRLATIADSAEKQKVKSALGMVDAMEKNFPGMLKPDEKARFFALAATGHALPEHDMSVDKVAGGIFDELQKDLVQGKDISGKLKLYKPILDHIDTYKAASAAGTFAGLAHKSADEERVTSDTNVLLDAVQKEVGNKQLSKAEYDSVVRKKAAEINAARKIRNSKDSGLHPDAVKHLIGDAANPPASKGFSLGALAPANP